MPSKTKQFSRQEFEKWLKVKVLQSSDLDDRDGSIFLPVNTATYGGSDKIGRWKKLGSGKYSVTLVNSTYLLEAEKRRLQELAGILNEYSQDEAVPNDVKDFFVKISKSNAWDMHEANRITVLKDGWECGFRDFDLFSPRYEDDDWPIFKPEGKKRVEDIIKKSSSPQFSKKYQVTFGAAEKNWIFVKVKTV